MRVAVLKRNVVELTRLCQRSNCGKTLNKSQKKFCSHVCRNMVLSVGNNGGAPEKYRAEFATMKFEEYLRDCKDGHDPTLIPTNSSFIKLDNARLPTLEGYAEFLGVSDGSLRNWTGEYAEFARTMDRLRRIQRSFLIDNGLSGRYSPVITKLLLGTNHGIVEQKQIDSTHKHIGIIKHLYETADKIERERYGLGGGNNQHNADKEGD